MVKFQYTVLRNTRFLFLGILSILIWASSASAQVAISVGAQALYDDNIFLEDDNGIANIDTLTTTLTPTELDSLITEEVDGNPDSDLITDLSIGVSAPVRLTPHLKIGTEGRIGVLIFSDQNDESRLTLDGVIRVEAEESIIPKPFQLFTSVALSSSQGDVSVASGTLARQAEVLDATLSAGVVEIALAEKTFFDSSYRFQYHAFLGEFTFQNDDQDGRESEVEGSDYISNSLRAGVRQILSERLDVSFNGVTDYISFVNVETNDLIQNDEDDLDRLDSSIFTEVNYTLSEKLAASGRVGIEMSKLSDTPRARTVTVLNPDGSTMVMLESPDTTETSFSFGGDIQFAPDASTGLALSAEQSRGQDIDGDRIISRSFSLTGSRSFGDRLGIGFGGAFTQFDNGDSLSNSTDRFEASASVQYSLTQAMSLSVGYNYINQDAPDDVVDNVFFRRRDYESNRIFISLSAGLIGTPSS